MLTPSPDYLSLIRYGGFDELANVIVPERVPSFPVGSFQFSLMGRSAALQQHSHWPTILANIQEEIQLASSASSKTGQRPSLWLDELIASAPNRKDPAERNYCRYFYLENPLQHYPGIGRCHVLIKRELVNDTVAASLDVGVQSQVVPLSEAMTASLDSTTHTPILQLSYRYFIKDLGSVNGVYLNDKRLKPSLGWYPLLNGARIRFINITPNANDHLTLIRQLAPPSGCSLTPPATPPDFLSSSDIPLTQYDFLPYTQDPHKSWEEELMDKSPAASISEALEKLPRLCADDLQVELVFAEIMDEEEMVSRFKQLDKPIPKQSPYHLPGQPPPPPWPPKPVAAAAVAASTPTHAPIATSTPTHTPIATPTITAAAPKHRELPLVCFPNPRLRSPPPIDSSPESTPPSTPPPSNLQLAMVRTSPTTIHPSTLLPKSILATSKRLHPLSVRFVAGPSPKVTEARFRKRKGPSVSTPHPKRPRTSLRDPPPIVENSDSDSEPSLILIRASAPAPIFASEYTAIN
jgi:hypothetical protein